METNRVEEGLWQWWEERKGQIKGDEWEMMEKEQVNGSMAVKGDPGEFVVL